MKHIHKSNITQKHQPFEKTRIRALSTVNDSIACSMKSFVLLAVHTAPGAREKSRALAERRMAELQPRAVADAMRRAQLLPAQNLLQRHLAEHCQRGVEEPPMRHVMAIVELVVKPFEPVTVRLSV